MSNSSRSLFYITAKLFVETRISEIIAPLAAAIILIRVYFQNILRPIRIVAAKGNTQPTEFTARE